MLAVTPVASTGSDTSAMKAKNINLLFAFVAVLLFGFSCFCISRINQTGKQRWLGGDTGGMREMDGALYPAFQEPHHQRVALWL